MCINLNIFIYYTSLFLSTLYYIYVYITRICYIWFIVTGRRETPPMYILLYRRPSIPPATSELSVFRYNIIIMYNMCVVSVLLQYKYIIIRMMTLCGRSVRVKVDFQSLHFTSTRNVHYRHDFDAGFSNNVKCTAAAESIDFSAHEYCSMICITRTMYRGKASTRTHIHRCL